jgi:hypothetical protein
MMTQDVEAVHIFIFSDQLLSVLLFLLFYSTKNLAWLRCLVHMYPLHTWCINIGAYVRTSLVSIIHRKLLAVANMEVAIRGIFCLKMK